MDKNAPQEKAQVKSRKRVADHGEVFTAEREVKAMCDLVKVQTELPDSRFLEPACGDGNFLAEILNRKLAGVTRKYKKSSYDWERYSLLSLAFIAAFLKIQRWVMKNAGKAWNPMLMNGFTLRSLRRFLRCILM